MIGRIPVVGKYPDVEVRLNVEWCDLVDLAVGGTKTSLDVREAKKVRKALKRAIKRAEENSR